jgi:hypothetical protein
MASAAAPTTLGDLTTEYTRGNPNGVDTRGPTLVERHNERMQQEKENMAIEKVGCPRVPHSVCACRPLHVAPTHAHPAPPRPSGASGCLVCTGNLSFLDRRLRLHAAALPPAPAAPQHMLPPQLSALMPALGSKLRAFALAKTDWNVDAAVELLRSFQVAELDKLNAITKVPAPAPRSRRLLPRRRLGSSTGRAHSAACPLLATLLLRRADPSFFLRPSRRVAGHASHVGGRPACRPAA